MGETQFGTMGETLPLSLPYFLPSCLRLFPSLPRSLTPCLSVCLSLYPQEMPTQQAHGCCLPLPRSDGGFSTKVCAGQSVVEPGQGLSLLMEIQAGSHRPAVFTVWPLNLLQQNHSVKNLNSRAPTSNLQNESLGNRPKNLHFHKPPLSEC